jgi:8-oxo-dGTP pyrophosphatase MutT (NUDIX family)
MISEKKQCSNCGNIDHEYKTCSQPITSLGIILLKLDIKINDTDLKNFLKNISVENVSSITKKFSINVSNEESDIEIFSILQQSMKFLMVSRKHSLGFTEFVRGRYEPDDYSKLCQLFKQMTHDEIIFIEKNKNNIDALWNFFWSEQDKKVSPYGEKDYKKSKQKLETLNDPEKVELTLSYYVKNISPIWTNPEWGFPKGRRNKNESNVQCAVREFEEESGFTNQDYLLLNGIPPIIEDFLGTNGVKYRHIYYVACTTNDKCAKIDNSNFHQHCEIGDIQFLTYNEAITMIRPYHTEKKKVLNSLFVFICENIISNVGKKKLKTLPIN